MPLAHIEEFIGYGPALPTVVFLGIEESAGGSEPSANQAARLQHFHPIMDLYDGTRVLARLPGFVDPFTGRGNRVQQWNRAAEFRLALAGQLWRRRGAFGPYWRGYLGRRHGDTFLMECFPLPRAGTSVRVTGYNPIASWPSRRRKLRLFTHQIRPDIVIAYGEPAAERVGELFTINGSWRDVVGSNAQVALGANDCAVARVGFFGRGLFNRREIPAITGALLALRGAGAVPLTHSWP